METKIEPYLKKPFRGITTIQLFDKDTGALLEEYHDENTYNDRLQYINYLDTILKCKGPNMPINNNNNFVRMNGDNANYEYGKGAFTFFERLNSVALGNTKDNSYVRQLFATLWLTNSTNAETAHGYPSGYPVGIVDACGNNAKFNAYTCTGVLNLAESYIGNDRLHLVFDFATDRCNVQFDSLWLYPSTQRCTSSSSNVNDYTYNVASFIQAKEITTETLNTTLLTTYEYISKSYKINGIYSVIMYSKSSYDPVSEFYAIQIYNNITGEIIVTYDWTTSNYPGVPLYYDESNNKLYIMRHYDDSSGIRYTLEQANDYDSLWVVNLNDGTYTRVGYLYNLLNLRLADLNIVNTNSRLDFIFAQLIDGSTNIIVRLRATDASTAETVHYMIIYSFDALTATFSLVKKIRLYTEAVYTSRSVLYNDILICPWAVDPNQVNNFKYSAIDIKTGTIKNSNIISIDFNIISDRELYKVQSSNYGYARGYIYMLYDDLIYRNDRCTLTTGSITGKKITKSKYFTAPWSTHNKLTSPVKKTDLTTMKIQYDIIWDSLSEVIIPALI